jgi:hypothetical protein
MSTLNLELRSIQFNELMSEETNNYAAKLYLDGKHIANVGNDGHGGCDRQYPVKPFTDFDLRALNALICSTYPTTELGEGLGSVPTDLEMVCNDLLTNWITIKQARAWCRKAVLFLAPNDNIEELGGYRQIKPKRGYALTPELADRIRADLTKKYPGVKIVNDMTDDQIARLWA